MIGKIVGSAAIVAFVGLIAWGGVGSGGNKEWVEQRCPAVLEQQGWQINGTEGFQWGFGGYGTPYGGAKVWYSLRKVPYNGLNYQIYCTRWGDQVQLYGPDITERNLGVSPRQTVVNE